MHSDIMDHGTNAERKRLEALHARRILDTADEEAFDRLTRWAQAYFGVPIALISLLDESRL
ncbi:hypothetical protein [Indioceanicola profundi]|uniref:hypothetical protein n=1 Tax=Indioceanicola profundi TaxID=2220096 RepID=UPI000E6A9C9F|nr:hypothetical protein [Indioceanicola profundi]